MSINIANPVLSEEAKAAVEDVLESGMLADGDVVRAFEREFAEMVGVEHAIATSSGTTALHIMLEAAGIGSGDTVVTTPFSFVATANVIRHAGAEPVFADVQEDTCNLDPRSVADVLDERGDVAGIMPVHLYGRPADMERFEELSAKYNVDVFEDAAQAHGASVTGEQVGRIGRAGAFSFYPTKNMTTGEGGIVTTDDDTLAAQARSLVNHGRNPEGGYEHPQVGYNYRMTNISAAIGRAQLERLPEWNRVRRENARRYDTELADVDAIRIPVEDGNVHQVYNQYTVRTKDRDRLIDALESDDIGYGIYYPKTIPDQDPYDSSVSVPTARSLTTEVLSLPVHPNLQDGDIETVIGTVKNEFEE